MVAFAVHHHGERGIFAVLTAFALTPILAIARTLRLDDRSRLARIPADGGEQKTVLKQM